MTNKETQPEQKEEFDWESDFNRRYSVIYGTEKDGMCPVVATFLEGRMAGERYAEFVPVKEMKDYIRELLAQAHADGAAEEREAILGILEHELALAHSTKSGKTSRLTSAYNSVRSRQLTNTPDEPAQ